MLSNSMATMIAGDTTVYVTCNSLEQLKEALDAEMITISNCIIQNKENQGNANMFKEKKK